MGRASGARRVSDLPRCLTGRKNLTVEQMDESGMGYSSEGQITVSTAARSSWAARPGGTAWDLLSSWGQHPLLCNGSKIS